jgi:hypothetical protein
MSSGILFKFYNSTSWKKVRQLALQRDNYLCQKCLEGGQITPGDVVHHLVEITPGNLEEFGLDLDNLVSWCRFHHESHHGRLTEDEEDNYYFNEDGDLIPQKGYSHINVKGGSLTEAS